jgi:hypothetical protein
MVDFLVGVCLLAVVIPIVAFYTCKLGRYGYLKAQDRFERSKKEKADGEDEKTKGKEGASVRRH